MRRTLTFPQRDCADAGAACEISQYRGTVVELPWPDFTGRRVLLMIDWNGQIFDQMAVASEAEAQRVTDRMTDDLERLRDSQQGPRLIASSPPSLPSA